MSKTLDPAFLEELGRELREQRRLYVAAHIKIVDGNAIARCDCGHIVSPADAKLVRTIPEVEERRTATKGEFMVGFVPVQNLRVVCTECADRYVENWRETKAVCEDLVKKGGEKRTVELSVETRKENQG